MFYAFTSYKNIKLFQIDIKSTFLNEFLNKEVFVEQSPNLKKIFDFENYVYKLSKALYGLRHDKLNRFLLTKGLLKGETNITILIKMHDQYFILVQTYIDDISFSASNKVLCRNYANCM